MEQNPLLTLLESQRDERLRLAKYCAEMSAKFGGDSRWQSASQGFAGEAKHWQQAIEDIRKAFES